MNNEIDLIRPAYGRTDEVESVLYCSPFQSLPTAVGRGTACGGGAPPSRRFAGANHLDKAARPRCGRAPQFWFVRQTAKKLRPDMGRRYFMEGPV